MKRIIGLTLGGLTAMLVAGSLLKTVVLAKPEPKVKINICHETGSDKNPWVAIQVDENSILDEKDFPYTGPVDGKGKPTKDGDKWCEDNAPVDLCRNLSGIQETLPANMEVEDKDYCYCKDGYHKVSVYSDIRTFQPEPNGHEDFTCERDKGVDVVGSCDGTFKVTVYGGDTRRTWRVEGVEAWVDYNESHEFVATSLNTVIEWWHENSQAWKVADETYVTRTPATNCEPHPITVIDNGPRASAPTAPVCTDGMVLKTVANFHIIRSGSVAELRWVPTEGAEVNIYYKRADQPNWEHAIGDQKNNGNFVIRELKPELGYTFGVQQKNGCGGGELATAVVVDPPAQGKMFRLSYFIWN